MSAWLASVTSQSVPPILIATALIGLAVVAFFLGHRYYRRWLMESSRTGGFPWTLEDLRQMRERGEVTQAEYRALRANLLHEAEAMEVGDMPPPKGAGSARGGDSGDRAAPKKLRKMELPETASEGATPDVSGDTVWSFDLKKSPPG